MKYLNLIAVVSIIQLLTSCTENIYSPALLYADIAYQPKPISFDSIKNSSYISVSLSRGAGENGLDELTFGQLNFSRAHTTKNFNFSYGAYGFTGIYLNNNLERPDPHYFDKKNFGGVGGRASADLYTASGRTNFRVIGIELGLSKEFGSFSKFRDEIKYEPDFYSNPSTTIVSAGISSEIIWHTKSSVNNQHGIRLFIGDVLTNKKFVDNPYYNGDEDIYYDDRFSDYSSRTQRSTSLSYFLQIQRFNFVAEFSRASRLSLGYRL